MEYDEKPEPPLIQALDQLKAVPPRDRHAAAKGRAQFLAQANELRQAVPHQPFWRHIGWNIFPQKEVRMPTLIALVLAFAVAFGGSGAVAVAAQEALPTDPLYAVKLFTEDVRVNLAGDPATQVDLLLDFSNRRTQEIAALGAQGMPVPEPVTTRLEQQTQTALQTAAGMDDATMTRVLARIQNNFAHQAQVVATVQAHTPDQAAPALIRVQEMLAARLAIVETALSDPHALREQFRSPRPTELPRPIITRTLTIPARPTELPRPTFAPTQIISPNPTDGNEPPRGRTPPASPPNGGPLVTPPRRP